MKQSLGVWAFCLLSLWACEQEERGNEWVYAWNAELQAPDVLPRCVQTLGSPYQEQCTYEYQLKHHLPVSCKIVHSEWETRTVSYRLEE